MSELDDLRTAASRKLDEQAHRARYLTEYYDGEQGVIAYLEAEERRIFRQFLEECQANWCSLVVNAVAERLNVIGFRFGAPEDSERAWAIWQASSMDADHEMVQTDALVTGSGFALVQPDDDNPTGVSITPESPEEAVVLYEPGNRRKRLAGFKRYGDLGATRQTEVLFTPDVIATWPADQMSGRPVVERNPAGVVGLVELRPQPRTKGAPVSEMASVMPIQDRIHTALFNRCVAMDYGAFRQIWASGMRVAKEVVKLDDGGQAAVVKRPFDIGANRLLVNENPDGRFGSFPESTLGGYIASVEQDVQQLAAISQTPPHYLLGSMINLSADAIKASEAGLVSKVGRRSRHLGEGWEEVQRVALGIVGSVAATNLSAEVVWQDPETRSEAQRVDALVKMATLGVPRRVLWEKWGTTPQEIDRWLQLAREEEIPA